MGRTRPFQILEFFLQHPQNSPSVFAATSPVPAVMDISLYSALLIVCILFLKGYFSAKTTLKSKSLPRKLVSPCRHITKRNWCLFLFRVPERFGPILLFSKEMCRVFSNLFVVIMNPNSPGTTWCSNLEINRVEVWTHMCAFCPVGRETRRKGGGPPSVSS